MTLLARGAQLDLDAGLGTLPLSLLDLGQAEAALAAGKERLRDLGEVRLDRAEGLLEALLDRLGQVVAQLLELGEAPLEIRALHGELLKPFLLGVVLLLGERVDVAERPRGGARALELRRQLVAVVTLCRLGGRRFEPALRLLRVGADARELDVDAGGTLRRLRVVAAQLRFGRPEPP